MIAFAPEVSGTLMSDKGRGWPVDAEMSDKLVAFHPTGGGSKGLSESEDVAPGTVGTLGETRRDAVGGPGIGVRRLTPTECERLQGLPDSWTDLGGTADSKRYSALGDAVTANVAQWLGERLAKEE